MGRKPKTQVDGTAAPAAPADLPIGIDPSDTDTSEDADPALQDERADGGEPRQSQQRMPFGMGSQEDPFAKLRAGLGLNSSEESDTVVPQPGSTQALTEEALARKGTTEYPDDMLITVKLWEVNDAGVAGDPILVAHNVLYSTAKEPLTWIEYGGKWYMELVQPETKKKLVRKTFTTRGDPAPKNWRPRIGGDEMTFEQFMQMFAKASTGDRGTIGVPAGVHANVEAGLRADVAKLEGKIERTEKERDDAKDAKNEAQRQRDMNQSKIDGLEREIRDLRDRERDLKAAVAAAPKGEKPEWAYIVDALGKKDDTGAVKLADIMRLQEKFQDTIREIRSTGDTDQFKTINGALDLVEKTRRAAGVTSGPGGGKDEDTLNKLLGLAGKAADLVAGRQRLVEIDRGGHPPAREQSPGQQEPKPQTDDELNKVALERTLKRIEVAFQEKWSPLRVGQMLASAINWSAAMDFASLDPNVKTFMGKIIADPDHWIVWYAENLEPKMEGATEYGKLVAEAFKSAMPRRVEQPKDDGGNGHATAVTTPAVETPAAATTPPVESVPAVQTPPPEPATTVATEPPVPVEPPKAN